VSHLLNTSQATALVIALRLFEQDLRQAERWLQGEQNVGVLYRTSLELSSERRAVTSARIAQALEIIARLAKRFDLHPVDERLTKRIAAAMSLDWANLLDTCSKKLVRYGEVDLGLAELLDPDMQQLAELALSIGSSVSEPGPIGDSR
jgi:hypothetical protein